MKSDSSSVATYYDAVTRWFLRIGMTQRAGAIHRAIVLPELPGVSPDDTVHHLLMQVIAAHPLPRAVADLGCGVGASMRFVVQHVENVVQVSGITISAHQASLAVPALVAVASYEQLPYPAASLDVVWAIESFAHSMHPAQFFAEVARVLRPGGCCVICDDMLDVAHTSRMLDAFQRGWMVPNIAPLALHCQRATAVGLQLVLQRDLTPGMHIHALPTWLASALVSLLPWLEQSMLWRSMVGSMALQQCYKNGIMRYQFVVFQKQ